MFKFLFVVFMCC